MAAVYVSNQLNVNNKSIKMHAIGWELMCVEYNLCEERFH